MTQGGSFGDDKNATIRVFGSSPPSWDKAEKGKSGIVLSRRDLERGTRSCETGLVRVPVTSREPSDPGVIPVAHPRLPSRSLQRDF